MSDFGKEFRHAARRLLRSPAFSIAAAFTLALGVGANATIFTVVNRVILRPLPYPESSRLLAIDHSAPGIDLPGSPGLSRGLYKYYRTNAHTFTDLAITRRGEWTLTGQGEPQRIPGVWATASLGTALRTPPALGRWFTEQETQDRIHVYVISHSLWSTRFGRDPNIVGRNTPAGWSDRTDCRRDASVVCVSRQTCPAVPARAVGRTASANGWRVQLPEHRTAA